MKNKNLASIAAVSLLLGFQSLIAFADNKSQGDVVVKKNPDGTVEAYDANNTAPAQAAPAPAQPRVIYRLKNDVGTRRISGVSVRTNADGSIDTYDEGSAPTPLRGGSSSHHARARSVTKTAVTKAKAKAHH